MHSVDKLPRHAAGRPGRNARDADPTSPDAIILDHLARIEFDAGAADDRPAAMRQAGKPALFGPLAGMSSRVWAVGGFVVLFLLAFAAVRFLLPEPTTGVRDDAQVAKPAPNPSASDTAVATPSLQRTDDDRKAIRVIPIHPSSDLAGEKPAVTAAAPPSTPPNEQTSDSSPRTEISPPGATTAQEPSQQLDLARVEDAKSVQQRLIELGFLFGAADGVWGSRSRKALQEFRVANGIGDGDTWDEATRERLLTASDAIAADTSAISFLGGWGVDVAQCRESPLTITESRAEAAGAACEFNSTQRESPTVWRLRAQCANNSERWNANIRFALSGDRLTWSSERGTTIYRRCPG